FDEGAQAADAQRPDGGARSLERVRGLDGVVALAPREAGVEGVEPLHHVGAEGVHEVAREVFPVLADVSHQRAQPFDDTGVDDGQLAWQVPHHHPSPRVDALSTGAPADATSRRGLIGHVRPLAYRVVSVERGQTLRSFVPMGLVAYRPGAGSLSAGF